MSRIGKIAIVLLCFAMCGTAAYLASGSRTEAPRRQKTNAIPVKNRELVRPVWILT